MQKTLISSKTTFWYKRVFPILWFGVTGAVLVGMLLSQASGNNMPGAMLIQPVIMMLIGAFVIKKFITPLADEVYDCGDALLVKNAGREDRIRLADIMNVNYTTMQRPPMIILDLRNESAFGKKVIFTAPVSYRMFKQAPIIEDLIKRVDDAKRKAA